MGSNRCKRTEAGVASKRAADADSLRPRVMVLEPERPAAGRRPPTAADASRGAPTGAATVAARVTGGGVGCGAPLPPEQHEQRKEEEDG